MSEREQADVHFLHIGKTGGTALRYVLEAVAEGHPWLHLHHHATRLADVPLGQRAFFFLRDPVARFVSGFCSRQWQGWPRYHAPWSRREAIAFAVFGTPNELALALSSPDTPKHHQAVEAMRSIQHVCDSYWGWLGTPDALLSRCDDVLFIGQQEHLADDVRVLAGHLGLDIGDLPSDPVAAHRGPEGSDRHLEAQAVENLMRWYAAEYQAIELCAQIARRAGFGGSLAQRACSSEGRVADIPKGAA